MARITLNDSQRRIIQLSQEWGVVLPPAPARLERPTRPPSFRTPADDHTAESLLHKRAQEISQVRPKSGLSRAFSTNNLKKGKNWEPSHILEVLASWISQSGSPGVVEALIAKLSAAGFDLGAMQQQKSSILSRRRSVDSSMDRARLLKLAVQNNQLETVKVLLPHADTLSLDICLPPAIRAGNIQMVEALIRYGASPSQTPEGQDAFRQACSAPYLSDMVGFMLQAITPPSQILASQSMVDATRAGCRDTILSLSRSFADGDHNQAEALQVAIGLGRRDLAIAIIMGNKPPQSEGVSAAFRTLVENHTLHPPTKLELMELLLCAGAKGDMVSHALQLACDSQFYDMANLLASYGVSIEYNEAYVLKSAISQGQIDLVRALLNGPSKLSATLASNCVSVIPPHVSNQDRYLVLDLLLRKGAKGTPLDEALVMAAEAGDGYCVDLLLRPFFPSPHNNLNSPRTNGSSKPQIPHEVASVDYQGGKALQNAVLRVDKAMVYRMLSAQPSPETLSAAFPLARNIPVPDRYEVVELFLKGALAGPSLHAALEGALGEDMATRDDELIRLLLAYGADINHNQGAALQSVIIQSDLQLLGNLLSKAVPQTAASQIPNIMSVADHRSRHGMMDLALRAGGSIGVEHVAYALYETLRESPVDMSLLHLVLQQGNANLNDPNYPAVKQAILNPDPKVLDLVLSLGKPSAETVTEGLNEIALLPSTEGKAWKLRSMMAKSRRGEDLGMLLAGEAQSLVQNSTHQPSFSALKELLDLGADPNAYDATSICRAVAGSNEMIFDMLAESSRPPTEASLALAMPHALHLSDPMDRLTFTKKLVSLGAPASEVNRALVHAIEAYAEDVSLISVLAESANTSDGEALKRAVQKESQELLDLLLSKTKHPDGARNTAFEKAMGVRDGAIRRNLCSRLLKSGISTDIASNALLVAARDGDLDLGNILMAHGATVSSKNGQAIIEACRGGSVEAVEMLLRSEGMVERITLERSFQAATEVGDLNKRALIFEKLLRRGVSGDPVHAQLLPAARYGEAGYEVLKVLLAAGADPNYNNGEALVSATQSALTRSLQLMLGMWDDAGRQKRPSPPTLTRAFKASWTLEPDIRFSIIQDLFQAGLPVTEDIHMALNDAVNEETPDDRLVELLLSNGASPLTNDCKTLVDATKRAAASSLAILLKKPVPIEHLNRAFSQSFTLENFGSWFSPSGKKTVQILLDHGAKGPALGEMLSQVIRNSTAETADIANEFIELLVLYDPDVNHNQGEPLRLAASVANAHWVNLLLQCRPSSVTLSSAFQRIFDKSLDESDALALFEVFSDYHDGENRVDILAQTPGAPPLLLQAMAQYPRSTKILTTLLDAGCYHDQTTMCQLHPDVEAENVTLLTWAIAQPQKKISSAIIQLLVERGSNVNSQSPKSGVTPLMLAIQAKRIDIVKLLLMEGADADATDYLDRSPLSMATDIGGNLASEMMGYVLAADPNPNDGSLHNVARSLNHAAVKVLLESGHDPDFPSTQHGGRSALGEVCLRGSTGQDLTPEREKAMGKVMTALVDAGSDVTIRSGDKSLLHLCFESANPVATTRVFLKVAMWKHINKPLNQYTSDGYTYSPTMYVSKVLPPFDAKEELLSLLYANRGVDVYYKNEGPQPEGATGLPEDLLVQERVRKARLERLTEESEDFKLSLARKRELANVENQIMAQKREMEDARRKKMHNDELVTMRSKAEMELSMDAAAHQRRMSQQRALADASNAHMRAAADAEVLAEDMRRRKMLEWENKANRERISNERALSAVRISEREELDRLDRSADDRLNKRLDAQKKLVESQDKLAKRLAAGPGGVDQRRQIGFISEELN